MDQLDAFRILASADRQLALHELVEGDKTASMEELSRQVASRRHRVSPERIDDTKVQRAHVRFAHNHLPKLRDAGVLTVNWDTNEVSLNEGEDVDQLFDAAEELDSWPPEDLLERPSGTE